MKVKMRTVKNKFPSMERTLRALDGKSVSVGVKGEHAWLAAIHEYGCDIKPVRAKYLTVPCNPKAVGKKAGDFRNLFFHELDDGSKWLVRRKGRNKLEFMFALMTHVKIPERSFLRAGFDKCHKKVLKKAERLLPLVMEEKMSLDDFYKTIGILLSDGVKDYAVGLSEPPKSQLTISANPRKTNPLVDTGDMINSIGYEVK